VNAIDKALSRMRGNGHILITGDKYSVSVKGQQSITDTAEQRRFEEEQAYGQFELQFRKCLPDATDPECATARAAIRNALVGAYRTRGIAMANVIIADQTLAPEEMSDLFAEVTKHAGALAREPARAAFLEAAYSFLVEPTVPQKTYLASVSQGFFLYHMTEKDPACARVRLELFQGTCWFIDSSVLIPLLAFGCHNHNYAADLFARLVSASATLFTTEDLLAETKEHLNYAIRLIKQYTIDSPRFLAAAMVREGYKQNLFIDGYIRECANGEVGTFTDYMAKIAPSGAAVDALDDVCKRYNITVVRAPEVQGFCQNDWGEIEALKTELAVIRKHKGTYRGDDQVKAEAEVLLMIRKLRQGIYALAPGMNAASRVYFVSQSRALDMVTKEDRIVTWTPEAVYRYVSSLPGVQINPELLQECMLHEYFYAGVNFIDKPLYIKFFGPSIRQAKVLYGEQISKYLEQTEQVHRRNEYDATFDSTPDLEKPFFVTQMGWQLAKQAEEKVAAAEGKVADAKERADRSVEEANKRVQNAESRAKAAEAEAKAEKKARITAEHRAAHRRNMADPKYVRKLAKQAKKRRRKNR
jgi:hypothetical protein